VSVLVARDDEDRHLYRRQENAAADVLAADRSMCRNIDRSMSTMFSCRHEVFGRTAPTSPDMSAMRRRDPAVGGSRGRAPVRVRVDALE